MGVTERLDFGFLKPLFDITWVTKNESEVVKVT